MMEERVLLIWVLLSISVLLVNSIKGELEEVSSVFLCWNTIKTISAMTRISSATGTFRQPEEQQVL